MFKIRIAESAPWAIHRVTSFGTGSAYKSKQLKGVWHRVFPVDAREIHALRLLDHQEHKFAPTSGNGVLISDTALRQFV
jgi:hypothetical protein